MAKYNSVFQRVEKKYLLTKEQYPIFLERIVPYMTLDEYGYHTICNIYYDTEADILIRRSMEKPRYKEKLRLRTYGVASAEKEAFIEIKKKYEKVVYKRRIALPYKDAVRYLDHGIHPEKDSQIMREIDYFLKFYHPKPKLFLAYDREAFLGKEDPNFRLTIDHNIRYREDSLDLAAGDYGDLYFDNGEMILEIKVAQAFPMWLTRILAELEIYPASFSKYGNIFTMTHIHKDLKKIGSNEREAFGKSGCRWGQGFGKAGGSAGEEFGKAGCSTGEAFGKTSSGMREDWSKEESGVRGDCKKTDYIGRKDCEVQEVPQENVSGGF